MCCFYKDLDCVRSFVQVVHVYIFSSLGGVIEYSLIAGEGYTCEDLLLQSWQMICTITVHVAKKIYSQYEQVVARLGC